MSSSTTIVHRVPATRRNYAGTAHRCPSHACHSLWGELNGATVVGCYFTEPQSTLMRVLQRLRPAELRVHVFVLWSHRPAVRCGELMRVGVKRLGHKLWPAPLHPPPPTHFFTPPPHLTVSRLAGAHLYACLSHNCSPFVHLTSPPTNHLHTTPRKACLLDTYSRERRVIRV